MRHTEVYRSPPQLTCLDLFSGVGGFALGFDRAGIRTTQFCEIDPYARRVLQKHWPDTPIHDDVRTLHGTPGQFDIICGGFPCQDISLAGKGAGLGGERSGLWWEFHRLIAEVRPAWVVAENVAALRSRGLDTVLGSLDALGYDAEWHCVPASAVGAPHRRDRVWIVAHPNGAGPHASAPPGLHRGEAGAGSRDGEPERLRGALPPGSLADADRDNGQRRSGDVQVGRLRFEGETAVNGDAGRTQWAVEPPVGRVADGVPDRVDRLRCLGNAVVPQIPELIGKALVAASIGPQGDTP